MDRGSNPLVSTTTKPPKAAAGQTQSGHKETTRAKHENLGIHKTPEPPVLCVFILRRPFIPYNKRFQRFDKDRKKINEQIRVPEVRVVDEKGEQLGVLPTWKAVALAKERKLDLVEVAEKANPPVCKIIDYGKYQYQQEKKTREGKVKQAKIEVKGIRLKMKTALGDQKTKAKQAEKFLNKGHKVKIDIMLRGREKAFRELARKRVEEFIQLLEIEIDFDQPIIGTPQGFIAIITKKK